VRAALARLWPSILLSRKISSQGVIGADGHDQHEQYERENIHHSSLTVIIRGTACIIPNQATPGKPQDTRRARNENSALQARGSRPR